MPSPITLIHLDSELIVVDKPAGVLSVEGRGSTRSLRELLLDLPALAGEPKPRVIHRLDREASGVIVFARTLAAQRALVTQFEQRTVEKIYVALVSGYVERDEGEIDLRLRYDDSGGRVQVARSRGKPAVTQYRILQRVTGNTWLECRPLTGRTHQIRAHLAAIGHPLSVDPTYGGGQSIMLSNYKRGYRPSGRREERPLIERVTLHALSISFDHPVSNERMSFEAPLPKDLRATLNQLSRL